MIGRKLRAKKVNEGIEMPRYAHEGDAGLDLRITETVTLEPMQKCVVGCGLAVEIPSGCVGLVFPRSGLAAKQGITLSNSVGVIDSGYRGEVCAVVVRIERVGVVHVAQDMSGNLLHLLARYDLAAQYAAEVFAYRALARAALRLRPSRTAFH